MTFKTSKEILTKVLDALTLVSGSSVQTYTEPMIYNYIQIMFDHLFAKRYWDHLTYNSTHTLDGTAGVVTDIIDNIESIGDIQWVRYNTIIDNKKVPYIKSGVFSQNGDLAYTAIAYGQTHYDNKLLQFNPKTATDEITIRARRKIPEFTADDIVPFDYLTILHAVTAHALSIDGMNPSAQQKHEVLFSDRYEQLVINESDDTIETDSPSAVRGEFTVQTL